jgi:hypothetical protein
MTADEKARVAEAEFEARRFLRRVEEWRADRKADPDAYHYPKQMGAMKRASMDLSRSLAKLRKGEKS